MMEGQEVGESGQAAIKGKKLETLSLSQIVLFELKAELTKLGG
jgi:hypothetical protein